MFSDLNVGNLQIKDRLFFILGPCVIEDENSTLEIAERIKELSIKLSFPFIFKASFDKANRTSLKSYRGPGLKKGLDILSKVKKEVNIPVITDIHEPWQAEEVAEVVSIIQIPAFLCRQTDLLLAAGRTGCWINIKKGQFLSAESIGYVIEKVKSTNNNKIMVTERGNTFGYNELVVDLKNILKLKNMGVLVIIDATHSVQQPPTGEMSSGGDRLFVPIIASGGVASGADGVFMEVHPNPEQALSDSKNSLALSTLESLIIKLNKIYKAVQ